MNNTGMMAKYFGEVVGDRERRQRAARHQHLFADFDHLEQLCGARVEVDHVGGFARGLRSRLQCDADVGLGERRRVVRAVAAHADEAPAGLRLADEAELIFGRCLGDEFIDARLDRR